jgi:hypothetical protein
MPKGIGALLSLGEFAGDSFLARAERAAERFSDPDCRADMKTLILALRDEKVPKEKQGEVHQRLEEVLGSF